MVYLLILIELHVPNAPCGVERHPFGGFDSDNIIVPNAPCGVERKPVKNFSIAHQEGS